MYISGARGESIDDIETLARRLLQSCDENPVLRYAGGSWMAYYAIHRAEVSGELALSLWIPLNVVMIHLGT